MEIQNDAKLALEGLAKDKEIQERYYLLFVFSFTSRKTLLTASLLDCLGCEN